jgi:chromosome segregation protein
MSKRSDTRFVTITTTPSPTRMDRLFGGDDGERGVSQIVSVELAEAELLAEAG